MTAPNMGFSDVTLPEGKIDPQIMASLLPVSDRSEISDNGVIIGPSKGEDAAVITGSEWLAFTIDPITIAGRHMAQYSVAVNCNDLVAMGAQPRYLVTSVLLPCGTGVNFLSKLLKDFNKAAVSAGISWVGGHTEITSAVVKPVVTGAAIGFITGKPWSTAGAQLGDSLVVTKWIGIEGSTLLARERPEARTILGGDYERVVSWLEKPGINIAVEGRILRRFDIHAAHDPTEGRIPQGIYELADCSEVAIEIDANALPIDPATSRLCQGLGIDALGLLCSGSLIFSAEPKVASSAVNALHRAGIQATVIGTVTSGSGANIRAGRHRSPIPKFSRDEIYNLVKLKNEP